MGEVFEGMKGRLFLGRVKIWSVGEMVWGQTLRGGGGWYQRE
jgi:hypothetical protein